MYGPKVRGQSLCSILAGPIAADFSQSYSDYLAQSYIQVGSYGNFIWTPKGKKGYLATRVIY